MIQHFLGCRSFVRIDSEAKADEFFCSLRDVLPIFNGLKLVVAGEDGLPLFGFQIPIKWGITSEEKIGGDAYSPDVDWFAMAGWIVLDYLTIRQPHETTGIYFFHSQIEDLGRHVL